MKIDNYARDLAKQTAAMQPLYDDIQGLMINGYRGYNFIRFLIFTIPEANIPAVRKFCAALVPGASGSPITITAATRWQPEDAKPPYRLNIGLTKGGLIKLITPANFKTVYNKSYQVMKRYSRAQDPYSGANPYGPAFPQTAQFVGDVGPSDLQNWWQTDGWQLQGQKPSELNLSPRKCAVDGATERPSKTRRQNRKTCIFSENLSKANTN